MFQNLPSVNIVAPKTFVLDSCDDMIASVLKEHGWKQISKNSNSWNLKWTWKAATKDHDSMQTGQYLNHFKGSDQISTKIGLSLLYKRTPTIMESGKSFVNFYPRSFNLTTEKSDFIKSFIQTGILNLLKKIVVCLQLFHQDQYLEAQKLKMSSKAKPTSILIQQIFQQNQETSTPALNPKNLKINGKLFIRLIFFLQNIFSLEDHFEFGDEQLFQLCDYSQKELPFETEETLGQILTPTNESLALVLRYHDWCMKELIGFYEDGFSNIWVVKSNHSSRGRNIVLVDRIQDVDGMDNGMKLIQKYIQNIWVLHSLTEPQIVKFPTLSRILRKKFDMRFWVLVKSFSPLIVYIYNQAYLRISSQSYRLDGLQQKNSHLTNFSINWKSKQKSGQTQPSYILYSHFMSFLKQQLHANISQITKNIHSIILQTLKLVQIKSDQRCFQLFGFDVILDAKLKPWILQCNMSPACSPRGELKSVLKDMTAGMLATLGFIQGTTHGWKLLYDDRKRLNKLPSCSKFVRETLQNFTSTTSCLKSISAMPNSEISVSSQKLQWKKYRRIEKIHYYIEKVLAIQKFLREKSNKNETILQNGEDGGKARSQLSGLLLIEMLAKLAKKVKKQSWPNLQAKPRKTIKRKTRIL